MWLDNLEVETEWSVNYDRMLDDFTNHLRPLDKLSGKEFILEFCDWKKSNDCLAEGEGFHRSIRRHESVLEKLQRNCIETGSRYEGNDGISGEKRAKISLDNL